MEDIDLVYLWCDLSDEKWNANRREVVSQWQDVVGEDDDAVSRYQSHDELRYSLRSAQMYAPWTRNVIIVVADDNTLPTWLDTSNPRLRVVRHSQIIPPEYLPCYNSPVIEHFLPRIPDLSEKYLYSNDDMFFFGKVTPEFFFDDRGEPIRRVDGAKIDTRSTKYYQHTISNAYKLVRAAHPEMTLQQQHLLLHYPHHGVDSYRRSHNLQTFCRYKEEILPSMFCPFRNKTDVQRALYLMEEVVSYGGKTVICDSLSQPVSLCFSGSSWRDGLDNALRLHPSLVCINAWDENTPDDFEWIRLAMDTLYPHPSSFEKS